MDKFSKTDIRVALTRHSEGEAPQHWTTQIAATRRPSMARDTYVEEGYVDFAQHPGEHDDEQSQVHNELMHIVHVWKRPVVG